MIKCEEGVFRAQGSNATLKAELRDELKRAESKISEKFGGAIEDIMELIDEAMREAHGGRRK